MVRSRHSQPSVTECLRGEKKGPSTGTGSPYEERTLRRESDEGPPSVSVTDSLSLHVSDQETDFHPGEPP